MGKCDAAFHHPKHYLHFGAWVEGRQFLPFASIFHQVTDIRGRTPIFSCARSRNFTPALLDQLLHADADCMKTDVDGNTLLHWCVHSLNTFESCITKLHERQCQDLVKQVNNRDESILMFAYKENMKDQDTKHQGMENLAEVLEYAWNKIPQLRSECIEVMSLLLINPEWWLVKRVLAVAVLAVAEKQLASDSEPWVGIQKKLKDEFLNFVGNVDKEDICHPVRVLWPVLCSALSHTQQERNVLHIVGASTSVQSANILQVLCDECPPEDWKQLLLSPDEKGLLPQHIATDQNYRIFLRLGATPASPTTEGETRFMLQLPHFGVPECFGVSGEKRKAADLLKDCALMAVLAGEPSLPTSSSKFFKNVYTWFDNMQTYIKCALIFYPTSDIDGDDEVSKTISKAFCIPYEKRKDFRKLLPDKLDLPMLTLLDRAWQRKKDDAYYEVNADPQWVPKEVISDCDDLHSNFV